MQWGSANQVSTGVMKLLPSVPQLQSVSCYSVHSRECDVWGYVPIAWQEDQKRNRLNGMSRHYVLQQTCEVLNNSGFYSRATEKKMQALRGIAPYSYGYCG